MFYRTALQFRTRLVNLFSITVTRKFNNCSRTYPLLKRVTPGSYQFQPARNNTTKRNTKQSESTINRKYLLLATYVSFGIGASIFVAFVFKYAQRVRRRARGIEDEISAKGKKTQLIRYQGVVLPEFVENVLDKVKTFEVRSDDVWVVSFPRSGTTWTQEMVYLIKSNMDMTTAKSLSIDERFPYLEYLMPGVDAVSNMPSPRYIKTHMPLKFLPKDLTKAKVIYVARNPKDVVVSYYHFTKMFKITEGEFGPFLDNFINSKVGYTPWAEHVLNFWELRDHPNVLFLTYEDMMEDLEGCIKKVAHFLDKPVTENDIKVIASHCSFTNMKTNQQVNYDWMKDLGVLDTSDPNNTFMRKGKVGGWRKYFDEETNYKINKMVAHKLHRSGLHFKYDLDK